MIWIKLLQLHVLLFGLAIVASRWCRPFPVARMVSPVAFSLGFFFLEHFLGLGTLPAIGWLATAAAAVVLYRNRHRIGLDRDFEIAYAALFAYSFLWRYSYPDLHGNQSERLMNVSFILNYSRGERLPPVDSWFPPLPFGMYYALQHYAAGLMARLLAVEPGVAYHLAFTTLIGLSGASAFLVIRHFTRSRWQAWLVMATLFVGGTGASALMHYLKESPLVAESMVFIGDAISWQNLRTLQGEKFLQLANVQRELPLQLPINTPSFVIQLGDYHAPVGSLFLLTASLACIVLLEKKSNPIAAAFLGATVPLTAATNAWLVPLQGLLVGGWWLYRRWSKQPMETRALLIGPVLTTVLLAPFVIPFLSTTSGAKVSLKLVTGNLHTPLLLGAILWLPLLLITAAQLARKDGAPLAKAGTLFFFLCFVLVEFVYADDHYMKNWERFNSTLKWWSWIWVGLLLTAAPDALHARSKLNRGLALAGLLLPLTFVYDLASYFVHVPKPTAGYMNGAGALETDTVYGPALNYLRSRPPGVVLQLVESDAYTFTPSLAVLAGQNAFLGWPEHERVWRGGRPEIYARELEARQFFLGVLPNPANWARQNGITDIVWLPTVHTLPPDAFPTIFNAFQNTPYRWKEFFRNERGIYGVWSLQQ